MSKEAKLNDADMVREVPSKNLEAIAGGTDVEPEGNCPYCGQDETNIQWGPSSTFTSDVFSACCNNCGRQWLFYGSDFMNIVGEK